MYQLLFHLFSPDSKSAASFLGRAGEALISSEANDSAD
jgi:hypothetical protein